MFTNKPYYSTHTKTDAVQKYTFFQYHAELLTDDQ